MKSFCLDAMHLCHEVALEDTNSRRNPMMGATFMDEDAVKRWMRVKKGAHRRTATESCLGRFLPGFPGMLRGHMYYRSQRGKM